MEDRERTSSTRVSREEEDIDIDPARASRSIYVTGFPVVTTPEELIIHFQRKKNGGGVVDAIAIHKRGAAVITFEDPEGKIDVCCQLKP